MKKIILLPLLALLLFISIIPCLNAQKKWAVGSDKWYGPTPEYCYYVYEECGDTTISANTYKKILVSSYTNDGSGSLIKTFTKLGALTRQINDSILFRFPSDSKDKLLYDFGVELGDTISLFVIDLGEFLDFRITIVDTVSVFGKNKKRIRMWELDDYSDDTWVEGIGSIQKGYFERGFPTDMFLGRDFSFGCFYSADLDSSVSSDLLSMSGMCQTMASVDLGCTETTSSPEPDIAPQFSLSPNPFSDYIQIENHSVNGFAKIYNNLGQEISSYPIDNQSLKIDTESLSPGVYIISIQDDSGRIFNKKMIKQN